MSEDITLTANFIRATEWFEKNRKTVMIGAAVIAVVILGASMINRAAETRKIEANADLIALSQNFDSEGKRIEAAPEAYFEVAAKHPGTAVAERATIVGAGRLFVTGKFAEAKAKFEEFMTQYPDSDFTAEALLGVAAATYAQGQVDPATQAYLRVLSTYGNSPSANQARLALAHIYESKDQPKDALRMYNELSAPNIPSGWSGEAQQAKSRLLEAHPELAETNAAPAMNLTTPMAPGSIPLPLMKPDAN